MQEIKKESRYHVRELFSHTVIYGFGLMLNRSVSIILLPLYTNYFTTEDLGLYTLILAVSFFLGVIYTYGMETAFIKFFIDEKEVSKRKEIYSSSLIGIFITSLFISVMLYLLSGQVSSIIGFEDLSKGIFLVKILAVMMIADTVYRFPLLLFRAELDTKTYSYLNIFTFVINIASNLFFILYIRTGIEGIFYSYFISVSLTLLISLFLTRKFLHFKISFKIFKELASFGNKFIYIGICIIIIDQADRFFLKYFYDESIVGIYWANYRLATAMTLIIAAYRFSWTPYFLNLGDNPDNKKIISTIFTYFIFAGVTLFLLFSLTVKNIIKIPIGNFHILSPEYWQGLTIIPVILLAYLISGIYHSLHAAPFFKNKTKFILIITLSGLAVNLFLNFFLVQLFGMNGAAVTILLTYSVMFAWIYFYSQKIYRISYEWNRILKIVLIALIIFILNSIVNITPVINLLLAFISISTFLLIVNSFKLIELKKVKILFKRPL
jgi:O-antigen/teichoic acid export membrane protein